MYINVDKNKQLRLIMLIILLVLIGLTFLVGTTYFTHYVAIIDSVSIHKLENKTYLPVAKYKVDGFLLQETEFCCVYLHTRNTTYFNISEIKQSIVVRPIDAYQNKNDDCVNICVPVTTYKCHDGRCYIFIIVASMLAIVLFLYLYLVKK